LTFEQPRATFSSKSGGRGVRENDSMHATGKICALGWPCPVDSHA
jgi:hypothetical protein